MFWIVDDRGKPQYGYPLDGLIRARTMLRDLLEMYPEQGWSLVRSSYTPVVDDTPTEEEIPPGVDEKGETLPPRTPATPEQEAEAKVLAFNVHQYPAILAVIVARDEAKAEVERQAKALESWGEEEPPLVERLEKARGTNDVLLFEEAQEEIKDLVNGAYGLLSAGSTLQDRAHCYWYAQIIMALDDDHTFLGSGSHTMDDAREALQRIEDGETDEDGQEIEEGEDEDDDEDEE
jgi:hypothetical protein